MGTKSDEASGTKQRKTTSLPSKTVDYLKAWMMSPEHIAHPYPTEKEKAMIMADTGIELKQLTNWFVNNRKRYWKPRVEARLQQQAQVQRAAAAAVAASNQRSSEVQSFNIGFFSSDVSNHQSASTSAIGSPWNAKQSLNMKSPTSGMAEQMQQGASNVVAMTGITSPPQQVYQYSNDASNSDCFPCIVTNKAGDRSISQTSAGAPAVSICSSSSDSDCSVSHQGEECSSIPSPTRANQKQSLLSFVKDEIHMQTSQNMASQIQNGLPANANITTQTEVIDINILNPSRFGKSYDQVDPTLEDVTISPNVPRDHVLRLFPDCNISYSFPSSIADNPKEIQKYRDAEVVKVKRQFLDLYLSENSTSDPQQQQLQQHSAEVSLSSTDQDEMNLDGQQSRPRMKRVRSSSDFAVDYMNQTPRSLAFGCDNLGDTKAVRDHIAVAKKKRLSSLTDGQQYDFKEACHNARNGYDSSLPTLEEAAFLFGFSKGE